MPAASEGEYGPWQYALGLSLWALYIALFLAGVLEYWRLAIGLSAASFWTWGWWIRRRRKRARTSN